jgi:membrane protein implicated in regulation of membrane protease activity
VDGFLVWVIIGLVLVIAEVASGTFYILVLGLTAFVAAAVAWLGGTFAIQVIVAVTLGLVGCIAVSLVRRRQAAPVMRGLDEGQVVRLDTWISRAEGLVKVRYRDALWDARIVDGEMGEPGDLFFIVATRGNNLEIAKKMS